MKIEAVARLKVHAAPYTKAYDKAVNDLNKLDKAFNDIESKITDPKLKVKFSALLDQLEELHETCYELLDDMA